MRISTAASWTAAVSLLIALLGFMAQAAFAQSRTPQEQLVGSWKLASADAVGADGTKVPLFGSEPKGTMIFTADGQFALIQMRGDLPRIAANNRDKGTPEEYKAIVSGSIAYYGSYAVQDGGKLILLKLDGSTYANLMGGEQRRIVTRLDADELTFTNPRNPAGMTLEVTWRRAR